MCLVHLIKFEIYTMCVKDLELATSRAVQETTDNTENILRIFIFHLKGEKVIEILVISQFLKLFLTFSCLSLLYTFIDDLKCCKFPDFEWRICRKFYIWVILYWFDGKLIKKQEILKQSCKDLFIWTKLPIIWLIIRSDNIFNM